ncbi:putative transcription initiation factor iie subunit alpha protein [Phaeoacremonium minimum UCRPA7]|uniref:Putative transcription initiation factor iie subunit alpha protein n=1 Tax=Phaeoacremonium minimum (strain UCR-PA7) TaxID=1286976 RepID=R8BA55_PHAM7|nr:putative transcription initiation factor iie subunit alpha protein [Phaeoacremonium minimum UCRPA7]EON96161.1 putative transcription initiation factor iie subunit alpha protein [Phaeoacremonium minimum UCRPA7]
MDLAQTLVRSVVRAFFDTRSILIIDALIIHSALRDDDMAYLMSMNTKDLHKLCARLRDDRFLAVHTRSELREGQQRPINRTYYYIDYRQTIDAIKWRVYKLDKDMQGTKVPASERKEYFCSRCKAEWTQMEVLDSVGPAGFLCHRCGSVLTHDVERHSAGHEKSTRLNNQFKFITDLLPKIDSVVIPDNTFDVAFANARAVERDAQHQIARSVAVDMGLNRPTAVKGLANTGPKTIEVSISTSEGPTEEEKEAERLRKEKIAKQNQLPSWMSNSTITGESFSATPNTGSALPASEADSKDATGKESIDAKQHQEIDDYFARLKAEQAALAAKKEEDEESGSEEDEDDFEDVVAGGNNAGITPASTAPTANLPAVPSPLRQTSVPIKREISVESPSKRGSPGSDDRPAKKVKLEEPAADDGESEDDMEFEDV